MIEPKAIIILGGGGHASVIAELLQALKRPILGFVAPQEGEILNYPDIKYLGSDGLIIQNYSPDQIVLINGLGSITVKQNEIRQNLYNSFKEQGYHFETIVHPTSWVASTAILKEGCQIMAGVMIQPNVTIDQNVIVNTRASIDHDCNVGHSAHVAPGVVLSGNVVLGTNVHVGVGATILQGVAVGSHAMICAGTVVTKDIQAYEKFKEWV
jgi:sugar O-acyltransferase (sialic acid O-acetyltransferase NeuD family)